MVHLQNTPTYYINYKKEEDGVNALMGLVQEEVARVIATDERNVNVSKSVTMEHCFKDEGKEENTKMASLYLKGQWKELHERRDIFKGKITKG